MFNLDELTEIVRGAERQPDQAKILAEAVLAAKQSYFEKTGLDRRGTVDTPVPYRIADVLYSVDAMMGSLNPPESIAAYRAVIGRITALQNDARYGFVFSTRMTLRDEFAISSRSCFASRQPVSRSQSSISLAFRRKR